MAYKVKGKANYITKRIRHILIARKLKLKTVGAYYYDWIWSNRGGSRIFLGGGALVSCST